MKLPCIKSTKKTNKTHLHKHDFGQLGFTLIELLVSVLIITVLSGIVIGTINSAGVRGKSQDTQRISDIRKIQTALELFYAANRSYPTAGSGWLVINGTDYLTASLTGVAPIGDVSYIAEMPIDPDQYPTPTAGPCNFSDQHRYNYRSDGEFYILTAIMEIDETNDDNACADLVNWGSGATWCPSDSDPLSDTNVDFRYCVENP